MKIWDLKRWRNIECPEAYDVIYKRYCWLGKHMDCQRVGLVHNSLLLSGDPLYVGMDLTIASFDAISEVNMDYTITLYLNQYWKDERLEFGLTEEVLTLSGDFADRIWVPDTFFANDKNSFLHDVTERNKLVRLGGDGSITYGMRFTATLACMMDLHYYPLDSQNCTVEIESCVTP
ncbi:unnamed protein product [Pieris brassicae]|uniref:Neurotransmitter-gated ion-channel ligand-binding domain-containing protein n=1 Tax=Pieris brassicae TaxID=7116 RepID=A0A9P0TR95_PIEBR|nr:unnamed protein product [Pieris brassicae]